jgi:hypothetical protein
MNSSHKSIAYKVHFERALILHHFFGITGEEGRMRRSTVGKRASLHMTDKSIMRALGLQCSCSTQCSDCWNKGNLKRARRLYALMTKLEQLHKVYEILLGARNLTIWEFTLMIGGS